jgi:hypothetical protein
MKSLYTRMVVAKVHLPAFAVRFSKSTTWWPTFADVPSSLPVPEEAAGAE